MKKLPAVAVLILTLVVALAAPLTEAGQCPLLIKQLKDSVANIADTTTKGALEKLIAEAQQFHDQGQHPESMKRSEQAAKVAGIELKKLSQQPPPTGASPTATVVRLLVTRSGLYDIEAATRRQLVNQGLRIAAAESDRYDVTLNVDYEETPCFEYSDGSKGTCIRCRAQLSHHRVGVLLDNTFTATSAMAAVLGSPWKNAVQRFEESSGFPMLAVDIVQNVKKIREKR